MALPHPPLLFLGHIFVLLKWRTKVVEIAKCVSEKYESGVVEIELLIFGANVKDVALHSR